MLPQKQLDVVCLIPELAYMTGLSDEMRSDFRVMKVGHILGDSYNCKQ